MEKVFKAYEKAGERAFSTKRKLVDSMIRELSQHAAVEEQFFYPVARREVPQTSDDVLESMEEHHIVKWILSELVQLKPDDERFDAKVTVLIENVRHHVREEEQDLFPQVRAHMARKDLVELESRSSREGERLRPDSAASCGHRMSRRPIDHWCCSRCDRPGPIRGEVPVTDEQAAARRMRDTVESASALVNAAEYPLYVVTAGVGDEFSGCLAGFVTQSSIKPVRFVVCISKVNHTFGIAERSKGLAVHQLGSDQRDIASRSSSKRQPAICWTCSSM